MILSFCLCSGLIWKRKRWHTMIPTSQFILHISMSFGTRSNKSCTFLISKCFITYYINMYILCVYVCASAPHEISGMQHHIATFLSLAYIASLRDLHKLHDFWMRWKQPHISRNNIYCLMLTPFFNGMDTTTEYNTKLLHYFYSCYLKKRAQKEQVSLQWNHWSFNMPSVSSAWPQVYVYVYC